MPETFDAGDMIWTSVSGEVVDSVTAYLPRPRWQRYLSWLIRTWRYPRAVTTYLNAETPT